jgi:hypothetical protein
MPFLWGRIIQFAKIDHDPVPGPGLEKPQLEVLNETTNS